MRRTVIIYTTMTKLTEDCEKRDTSSWPRLSSRIRSKQPQNESETQGQKPQNILQKQSDKEQATTVRGTLTTGDICVEDPVHHRRRPSTPPIDATIRRHQPKPTTDNPSAPSSLWRRQPVSNTWVLVFHGQYRRRTQPNVR